MVLAKSRLVCVENIVLREIIHSLVVNYFFYNFRDWPKIFTIPFYTEVSALLLYNLSKSERI